MYIARFAIEATQSIALLSQSNALHFFRFHWCSMQTYCRFYEYLNFLYCNFLFYNDVTYNFYLQISPTVPILFQTIPKFMRYLSGSLKAFLLSHSEGEGEGEGERERERERNLHAILLRMFCLKTPPLFSCE